MTDQDNPLTAAPPAPAALTPPLATPPIVARPVTGTESAPPESVSPPPAQTTLAAGSSPSADPVPDQMVPRSRVDQITREKWEARRRAQELEQELNQLRAAQAALRPEDNLGTPGTPADSSRAPPPAGTHASPEALEQVIHARAQQLAQAQAFTERCNATYRQGVEDPSTPGFQEALRGFDLFGGLQRYPDLVEAVTSVPDGHRLLHHLGTHLDEAERILSLPPAARGMELGRLSARITVPVPRPTAAPTPPVPIRGNVASGEPGPDDQGRFSDQSAYRAWRAKQRSR